MEHKSGTNTACSPVSFPPALVIDLSTYGYASFKYLGSVNPVLNHVQQAIVDKISTYDTLIQNNFKRIIL